MPLPEPWSQLKKAVIAEVKPSPKEYGEIDQFMAKIKRGLSTALAGKGIEADVEIHGSVARDTWLRGQRDIDVFIILRHGASRRDLLAVNEAVKGFVGEGWVEAYAEHPYVKKAIGGFDVEFIPCFRIEAGKRLVSAVDRSPLHTGYLLDHMTQEQRDEVRLLKMFARGIGVYGAEIRVGGFSGYLCELLILAFGSFDGVVTEAAQWGDPPVIQLVKGAKANLVKFKEPLVVIDPVDENRNVASAVTETALWTFVAAARAFANKPDEKFFTPPIRKVSPQKLLSELKERSADVLFVVIPDEEPPVPDTLWGQLYRAEKALGRALGDRGFRVFRSASWSDEGERHILVYEVESIALPPIVKRVGPPVKLVKDSENFIGTYLDAPERVSGPGVEGGKWWVEVKRRHTFTGVTLRDMLAMGCEELGVPKRLAEMLRESGTVLINDEIEGHMRGEFPLFLDGFLRGRPDWLG